MSPLVSADELNILLFHRNYLFRKTFQLFVSEFLHDFFIACHAGFFKINFPELFSSMFIFVFFEFLKFRKICEWIINGIFDKLRDDNIGHCSTDYLAYFVSILARIWNFWWRNYWRWASRWKTGIFPMFFKWKLGSFWNRFFVFV